MPSSSPSPRPGRFFTWSAALAVLVLAGAGFVLTYEPLRVLARTGGVEGRWAPAYPVMADTLLVVALLAVVVARRAHWFARTLRWLLLLVLLAGGAALAVQHAVRGYGSLPSDAVKAGVAVAPNVMLAVAVWLWLTMIKQVRTAAERSPGPVPDAPVRREADAPPLPDAEPEPEFEFALVPPPAPAPDEDFGAVWAARTETGAAWNETREIPRHDARPMREVAWADDDEPALDGPHDTGEALDDEPATTRRDIRATEDGTRRESRAAEEPDLTQRESRTAEDEPDATRRDTRAAEDEPDATRRDTRAAGDEPDATQRDMRAAEDEPEVTRRDTRADAQVVEDEPDVVRRETRADELEVARREEKAPPLPESDAEVEAPEPAPVLLPAQVRTIAEQATDPVPAEPPLTEEERIVRGDEGEDVERPAKDGDLEIWDWNPPSGSFRSSPTPPAE
ncbi:hypothetical protein BTM25_00500 [Actinomadura rubteroloni]|uniref:DUF2637 domain-containing protein n=1 Tax=Actinomadura rubteroloni TaxID=1926885 RepID=A0A2P4UKV0_9ACTN|nr:DUF2637 domain-containing protein [Actinomadura rubteroloni]POM25668.1 hypothetical protein BTM25_00500 [Actinomadura rubteroloni]